MTNKLVDGKIVKMSVEEGTEFNNFRNNRHFKIRMENLRFKRTALLKQTDFYALSDVTMSEEMTTYRQALRDLPDGLTTVDEVEAKEFPTKTGE